MQKWTVAFALCLTLAIWGTNMVPQFTANETSVRTVVGWSAAAVRTPLTP